MSNSLPTASSQQPESKATQDASADGVHGYEDATPQPGTTDKTLPVATWKLGQMQAAAYFETIAGGDGKERTTIKISFGKRSKKSDGSGWQTVRTLFPADIPAMVAVLTEAQRFVFEHADDNTSQ